MAKAKRGRGGSMSDAASEAPAGGGGAGGGAGGKRRAAKRTSAKRLVAKGTGAKVIGAKRPGAKPKAVGGVVVPRMTPAPRAIPLRKIDARLTLAVADFGAVEGVAPRAIGGVVVPHAIGGPVIPRKGAAKDKGKLKAKPTAPAAKAKLARGLLVPSTVRHAFEGRAGTVDIPASVSDLAVGEKLLMSQASPVEAQRVRQDVVSVLVDAADMSQVEKFARQNSAQGVVLTNRTASLRLPLALLPELASLNGVNFIEANARLKPLIDLAHVSANLIGAVGGRTAAQTGKGVLVGIVDTGIDAAHAAFKNENGNTRIIDYLDQTTGARYDGAAINAGSAADSPDEHGHGTHVAGIAAGTGAGSPMNRYAGVAPEADLAIVKTTFDTVAIADAVAHVFDLAAENGGQSCVINLSLGGHYGAHDGSSLLERTIDTLCETPGRVVVVSAGNEGDAQIHAGTVLPRGGANPARWVAHFELTQQVIDNTLMGLMWVQVWTQHEDDLIVTLRSPNGELFVPPENGRQEADRGKFFVDASHQVAVYSGDNLYTFGVFTVPQAQWLQGWSIIVREDRSAGKHGVEVGAVHAWITGDDMGRFTEGLTRTHLVGMPGTAYSALTVASYATRKHWNSQDPTLPTVTLDAVNLEDVSYFSSPGPTRDGQNKPDVAAPGQWLVSTLSADATSESMPPWLRLPAMSGEPAYAAMQGTSMAAPYVTGAIALLMEKHPGIHWAEARRRLIKTAKQDRFSTPCWNERWGYGKIDVERLLSVEPG